LVYTKLDLTPSGIAGVIISPTTLDSVHHFQLVLKKSPTTAQLVISIGKQFSLVVNTNFESLTSGTNTSEHAALVQADVFISKG
jgi:hypothetical protein